MKVYSVDNTRYNRSLGFRSCLRTYYPVIKPEIFAQDLVRTSTNLFREDLNWKFLTKYIIFNFLKTNKVNTYSLAGSDGSEAYSFAVMMMSKLPESMYNKFFPIISSDIDRNVLEGANSRRINIHDCEFAMTNRNYHLDLNDYFVNPDMPLQIQNDDIKWAEKHKLLSYEPIDELKQAVQFRHSDILTELSQIKDEGNSIVFCRNVMPYLKESYVNDVIKTASEKLKTGSLFITGEYDDKANITAKLNAAGFYQPVLEYSHIFQRNYT